MPLSVTSATQGVEIGCLKVPLYNVELESDLVSSSIVVGVRPSIPVKVVSFMLGNVREGWREGRAKSCRL